MRRVQQPGASTAERAVLEPDAAAPPAEEQLREAREQIGVLLARVRELENQPTQLEAYAGDLSRTYAELRRYVQSMTVLHEVNTRIASSLDPREVLETLLESLGHLIPFEVAAVYLTELDLAARLGGQSAPAPADPVVRLRAWRGPTEARRGDPRVDVEIATENSPAAEAIRTEQAVARDRALAVPLRAGGLVFGALEVRGAEVLQDDQRRLVDLLGAGASVALQNAHLYQETQRLATTDSLTGLSNHRHFYELLEQEAQRAHRQEYAVGLIMLDLDHFKRVNDQHGHPAGDAVLRRFAQVVRSRLRRTDAVGRLGGEEFAAILPDATLDEVRLVAEKVRRAVSEIAPLQTEDGLVTTPITTSIGGAALVGQKVDGRLLLQRADEALYAAKRAGRNRVYVWDEGAGTAASAVAPRQEEAKG